jgi:hypothetical protein
VSTKYHPGEIEVQEHAGVRPMAERVDNIIRPTIRRWCVSSWRPEACMAILGPERHTRDGETEGTDLLAVPPRRGEVRA